MIGMMVDNRLLPPGTFTQLKMYEIVGDLENTNCVIVAKNDHGERVAICKERLQVIDAMCINGKF